MNNFQKSDTISSPWLADMNKRVDQNMCEQLRSHYGRFLDADILETGCGSDKIHRDEVYFFPWCKTGTRPSASPDLGFHHQSSLCHRMGHHLGPASQSLATACWPWWLRVPLWPKPAISNDWHYNILLHMLLSLTVWIGPWRHLRQSRCQSWQHVNTMKVEGKTFGNTGGM